MRTNQKTTLKITRITGTSSTGKETHDFVNLAVNPELTDKDMLSIGDKLTFLQKFPIDSIGRIDSGVLMSE